MSTSTEAGALAAKADSWAKSGKPIPPNEAASLAKALRKLESDAKAGENEAGTRKE